MKNSFQCVKCGSSDVIKIEGSRMNQTQYISLMRWGTTNAVVDRYLCVHCGYIEEWIQMNDKFKKWVKKNRDKGTFNSDFV